LAVGIYVRSVNVARWGRSRRQEFSAHLRWRRGAPARRRIAATYRGILKRRIDFETVVGTVPADGLAIVMCLWNRPGRIEEVLRLLDGQATARPLRLVLWNNQPADSERYRSAITAFRPAGALRSIELHTSQNIGGIGRFIAMRELARRGYRSTFIMLDDDENVSPSFVEDLIAYAGPRTIAGVWAWLSADRYWTRGRVERSGEIANHLGTGGVACDSAIVRSERFFRGIPADFLFMEDMWMSRCALNSGWSLIAVDSPVEFVRADLDQGHAIIDDKERFWRWMSRAGRIPSV